MVTGQHCRGSNRQQALLGGEYCLETCRFVSPSYFYSSWCLQNRSHLSSETCNIVSKVLCISHLLNKIASGNIITALSQ
jgi:hypothetical protein